MGWVDWMIGVLPTRPHPGGNNPPTLSDAERVSFMRQIIVNTTLSPPLRIGEGAGG